MRMFDYVMEYHLPDGTVIKSPAFSLEHEATQSEKQTFLANWFAANIVKADNHFNFVLDVDGEPAVINLNLISIVKLVLV